MGSENKRWPVLRTYTNSPARHMTFQLWDGYGVKLDGAGLTMTLKATLDGVTVFDDLAMTAADESNGLYYATYNFQNPGDHDSQIKVTNAQSDTDFCDPVTLEVREPV